jgi:hypothetical protein
MGTAYRGNMQVNAGKLQILTIAAMLVLVSGGIAAYAQGQSASSANLSVGSAPVALAAAGTNSTSTQTNSTTSTSTVTSTVTSTATATSTVTSTSTTSTTTANNTLCQPPTSKVGRLVLPITATGSSAAAGGSISFSSSRGCHASITTVGGIFNVQIVLQSAKPVTEYNAVLVANGTDYTLGNMVTGPGGNGQMTNQVLLTPGTYVVSILIYDVSSNPGHSTLVLQTGQGTIVSPPFPTASSNQQPIQGGQHK